MVGALEALRSLIPVRSSSLRSQFYFVLILIDRFAETEVRNLDLAIVKQDVLRFQVVVNDLLGLIVQVLEPRQDLGNNELGLLLRNLFVLFQIHVQAGSLTKF